MKKNRVTGFRLPSKREIKIAIIITFSCLAVTVVFLLLFGLPTSLPVSLADAINHPGDNPCVNEPITYMWTVTHGTQTYYRVLVHSTGVGNPLFSNAVYDSGWLLSSDTSYTGPGFPVGHYQWRVLLDNDDEHVVDINENLGQNRQYSTTNVNNFWVEECAVTTTAMTATSTTTTTTTATTASAQTTVSTVDTTTTVNTTATVGENTTTVTTTIPTTITNTTVAVTQGQATTTTDATTTYTTTASGPTTTLTTTASPTTVTTVIESVISPGASTTTGTLITTRATDTGTETPFETTTTTTPVMTTPDTTTTGDGQTTEQDDGMMLMLALSLLAGAILTGVTVSWFFMFRWEAADLKSIRALRSSKSLFRLTRMLVTNEILKIIESDSGLKGELEHEDVNVRSLYVDEKSPVVKWLVKNENMSVRQAKVVEAARLEKVRYVWINGEKFRVKDFISNVPDELIK